MKKLVLVFIIGSMILNGCGAKEESENTLDQNLQIESENISNAETEKSNTESITVEAVSELAYFLADASSGCD